MTELANELNEMVAEVQQTGGVENASKFAQNFVDTCFGASYKAGWWTDLKTGEDLPCDVALKMSLVHSEISEALEGARKNLPDDKLEHRTMFEVELADVAIRLGDLVGRIEKETGKSGQFAEELSWVWAHELPSEPTGEIPADLDRMHYYASRTHMLDVNFTGNYGEYMEKLADLFFVVLQTVGVYSLDFGGAVAEKIAFNANRPDHKIENRARGNAGDKTF